MCSHAMHGWYLAPHLNNVRRDVHLRILDEAPVNPDQKRHRCRQHPQQSLGQHGDVHVAPAQRVQHEGEHLCCTRRGTPRTWTQGSCSGLLLMADAMAGLRQRSKLVFRSYLDAGIYLESKHVSPAQTHHHRSTTAISDDISDKNRSHLGAGREEAELRTLQQDGPARQERVSREASATGNS